VVEHLRVPEDVDRELLLQMMLAREALEPTASAEESRFRMRALRFHSA